MNLLVLIPIIAVMVLFKFLRLNILAWMAIWWIAIYIALSYGINPPIPSSIIGMFMFIVTLSLLAYLSASTEYLTSVKQTLIHFIVSPRFTPILGAIVILLPLIVAARVYMNSSKQPQPPASGRTIHPPPPVEISFKGKTIDLVAGDNPYRELEQTDPESFKGHVENGRRVYFQNCFYCHGDNMSGDGIFAHGFDPIPANFTDPTTIAMLQENYLFWRIAKGAPGLPPESTPWSSAMPAWEKFLSEEEIWDVILYLYDHTDQRPRAREEH